MGRGNPGKMVAVRLEPGMLAALEAAVERRNNAANITETWDRSEWIRQAIADKLDKYERGRKSRKPRKGSTNRPKDMADNHTDCDA